MKGIYTQGAMILIGVIAFVISVATDNATSGIIANVWFVGSLIVGEISETQREKNV